MSDLEAPHKAPSGREALGGRGRCFAAMHEALNSRKALREVPVAASPPVAVRGIARGIVVVC